MDERPSKSADDLASSLETVLAAERVSGLRRLSGGASRETWAFDASFGSSDAARSLILQRQREGSERDMGLEATLLRVARAGGVRVPEVVAASTDPGPLGAPYMITGLVPGETIARKILRDPEFERARAALPAQLGQALAAL